MSHSEGIERAFRLNDFLKYLGTEGEILTIRKFQKYVVKAEKGHARVKYIERGGKDLNDEDDIIKLLKKIEEVLEAESEVIAEAP